MQARPLGCPVHVAESSLVSSGAQVKALPLLEAFIGALSPWRRVGSCSHLPPAHLDHLWALEEVPWPGPQFPSEEAPSVCLQWRYSPQTLRLHFHSSQQDVNQTKRTKGTMTPSFHLQRLLSNASLRGNACAWPLTSVILVPPDPAVMPASQPSTPYGTHAEKYIHY